MLAIREKRLRPHSPISMLSLLCYGSFDKISKQKIINQLYIQPNTESEFYADVEISETKHTLDVPILLRTLFHLPSKYERKIKSWYPLRGITEGFSFIISPTEVKKGVILEDPKVKEYYYLSGLPYKTISIVTDNYERFVLTRQKKGGWEGFNHLVERFGMTGGERIGFALTDKGQVYFEVIEKDLYWSNWSDFLNKIHLSKSSKEVAFLLRRQGITNTDYQINEALIKGLFDLGFSYETCQQVLKDLRDLNKVITNPEPFNNEKLGIKDTTDGYVTASYAEVERSDRWFMGSTEDLLAELVKRFNLQNEENQRLREENRKLNEKIESLEKLKKLSVEKEVIVGSKDSTGEIDKSRLKRFSVLYQKNGAILTYIANILAMAGDEGLEISDLQELVYFHYSIDQKELEQIIELYPFFIKRGETISVDSNIHSAIVSLIPNNLTTTTSESTVVSKDVHQTEIKGNKEYTAEEILEALNLERVINENSEEEFFEELHDYFQMLFGAKQYSILIELESMVRDLFLMDLHHNLFFRRCLLLLSAAFLLDNNKMRSETYWDKYLVTCKGHNETDRENLILALQLSFILETDDSFFDIVGRESIESANGIELELYKLVYDINENRTSPDLVRKFERALDRYRESIAKEKKKYIDLHREYFETVKISIEREEGN